MRNSGPRVLILEELEMFGIRIIFWEGGAVDYLPSKLMVQLRGAMLAIDEAKVTGTDFNDFHMDITVKAFISKG